MRPLGRVEAIPEHVFIRMRYFFAGAWVISLARAIFETERGGVIRADSANKGSTSMKYT